MQNQLLTFRPDRDSDPATPLRGRWLLAQGVTPNSAPLFQHDTQSFPCVRSWQGQERRERLLGIVGSEIGRVAKQQAVVREGGHGAIEHFAQVEVLMLRAIEGQVGLGEVEGAMVSARLAEGKGQDLRIAPHGPLAVSYTHLTLPTNREV